MNPHTNMQFNLKCAKMVWKKYRHLLIPILDVKSPPHDYVFSFESIRATCSHIVPIIHDKWAYLLFLSRLILTCVANFVESSLHVPDEKLFMR